MIGTRLAEIRARMDAAARGCGRDPADVQLIAVSKTFPAADIVEAQAAGQVHFGESYAQELRDKSRVVQGVQWHFIGRIQTNKAKYIAPVAHRVHAITSAHQAEALAKRAPAVLKCMVAVNVGHEASKSGVAPSEALDAVRAVNAVDGIAVCGLMCLPPWRDDPAEVAPFYEELADLAARGRADGLPLHELSMGMSHDFEVAIAHGATWVRVGTAIFGSRDA